jgi:hypothetical protein
MAIVQYFMDLLS